MGPEPSRAQRVWPLAARTRLQLALVGICDAYLPPYTCTETKLDFTWPLGRTLSPPTRTCGGGASSRFGTRTDMASRSRLLAIIGPPASEPTAYARLIANGLRCPTLSVGQMLATEVEHGTHAGLKVADFVAAHPGDLVPVPLVAPLVQQRLQQFPGADIVALAGFPRSLQQWKALQTMGYSPELLHLNLSEELQRERLKSRRVCSACGWPAFDGHAMCECDAPTHRVSSDEGEHAEARLSAYATHTRPLLEHLRGRGIAFHEVEVVADLAQMDEQVAAVVSRP